MQQELSRPERIVIADVAVGIRPNIGIQQESLAILNDSVGVLQVSLSLADRFDFGTAECDAALVAIEEKVIMAGGAIDSGIAFSGGNWIAGLFLCRSLTDRMCGLAGHRWSPKFHASTQRGMGGGGGRAATRCYT